MHTNINVMSNDRLPCTVIYNEEEVYYNCGVRIKGSQRARLNPKRVGFNVGFPKDNLFRGVHRTVAIDRSEGQNVGQRELLFDLMATSSGGIPGEFNDLCYVISPDPAHTSAAILQMARFSGTFLDTQFEDGGTGQSTSTNSSTTLPPLTQTGTKSPIPTAFSACPSGTLVTTRKATAGLSMSKTTRNSTTSPEPSGWQSSSARPAQTLKGRSGTSLM